jgi:hypothetical protein
MSNPTSNFGWQMPTNTDLVTDLPADFEVFGQAVDSSMADLKGGTSGQILSKNSNTDMDFVWIANDQGDITGVTATSPLTGGGTSGAITVGIQASTTTQSGAVQLTDSTSSTSTTTAATPNSVKTSYDLAAAAVPKSTVTTAGDVIYATGSSAVTRLGIGTAGQVLTVNGGGTAPSWATPSSSPTFVGCYLTKSADQSIANGTVTALTFDTESFDTSAFHSTVTNTSRITIPAGKAGYYAVYGTATFAAAGSNSRSSLLKKNGTTFQTYIGNAPSTGASTSLVHNVVMNLVVGDYIEMFAYQSSGGAVNISGNSTDNGVTNFGCTYLGA